MTALTSIPPDQVLQLPMAFSMKCFTHYGGASWLNWTTWQTVVGGSHRYVQAFLQRFQGRVEIRSPVRSIRRDSDGVMLTAASGKIRRFDKVIIAAHADESLKLLADPSDDERRLLGPWRYLTTRVVVHTDSSLMPPRCTGMGVLELPAGSPRGASRVLSPMI